MTLEKQCVKQELICENCGETFIPKNEKNTRFCRDKCYHQFCCKNPIKKYKKTNKLI